MVADGDGRKFTDKTLCAPTDTHRVETDALGITKCFDGDKLTHIYTPSAFNQSMMTRRGDVLFCERDFHHYLDIGLAPIHPQFFCVPKQKNNPLFDAFFFDGSNEKIFIIYILQMTIAKRHGGSESGLRLVETLTDRVRHEECVRGRQIQVRYLLVAPARAHTVSWIMPEGWDTSNVKVVSCSKL
ncbi:hypothetical protein BT96DRAFT_356615 [Gymnopus androsaceus JB14]|uniref:Uncharacterized protein n=1 Tax=Gymnopus androsaceus JB14 TaxID=1447944 RepID=A0A6A4I6M7_9AGAR|nr:hypothetical protein BT96DRAFT_356615 [Gymnopus androsaceus JB14]